MVAFVDGYSLCTAIYFHLAIRVNNLRLTTDIFVGYAVIVVVFAEDHMVVPLHLCYCFSIGFKHRRRQGSQKWLLLCLKPLSSAIGFALHFFVIERIDLLTECGIEFF